MKLECLDPKQEPTSMLEILYAARHDGARAIHRNAGASNLLAPSDGSRCRFGERVDTEVSEQVVLSRSEQAQAWEAKRGASVGLAALRPTHPTSFDSSQAQRNPLGRRISLSLRCALLRFDRCGMARLSAAIGGLNARMRLIQ